ncbi:MAG: hypothetical protein CML42_06790 [Rhodobacteraceae bacterium]|nr:hypothetical protein [Paracoccaceae bacterium]|tara:strand:- start:1890 stop:2558 length:669 start_codon:yes stop_codon:yes gene_type:complete
MKFISNSGEVKKKKDNTFNITFNKYDQYSYLWDNLYFTDIIEKKALNKKITYTIKANEVITLKDYLQKKYFSYSDGLLFFNMISQQLFTLDKNNVGISHFDIEDIVVVKDVNENNLFYFVNISKIIPKKNNLLEISSPFNKKHPFLSPEMKNINTIPSKITKYSSCYSLGILTIYGFLKNNQKTINENTFDDTVGFLGLNKLFYSLKRSIKNFPKDRKLLYI